MPCTLTTISEDRGHFYLTKKEQKWYNLGTKTFPPPSQDNWKKLTLILLQLASESSTTYRSYSMSTCSQIAASKHSEPEVRNCADFNLNFITSPLKRQTDLSPFSNVYFKCGSQVTCQEMNRARMCSCENSTRSTMTADLGATTLHDTSNMVQFEGYSQTRVPQSTPTPSVWRPFLKNVLGSEGGDRLQEVRI